MSSRKSYAELHPKKKKNQVNLNASFVDDEKTIQNCPKCNVYIQKTGGCNYMKCKNCKTEFCWYCSKTKDECHDKTHNSHS